MPSPNLFNHTQIAYIEQAVERNRQEAGRMAAAIFRGDEGSGERMNLLNRQFVALELAREAVTGKPFTEYRRLLKKSLT